MKSNIQARRRDSLERVDKVIAVWENNLKVLKRGDYEHDYGLLRYMKDIKIDAKAAQEILDGLNKRKEKLETKLGIARK